MYSMTMAAITSLLKIAPKLFQYRVRGLVSKLGRLGGLRRRLALSVPFDRPATALFPLGLDESS